MTQIPPVPPSAPIAPGAPATPGAPVAPGTGIPRSRCQLRDIATYQRWLMICILGDIVGYAAVIFAPSLRLFFALPLLAVDIAGIIFVFLLATKVYSVGVGILMGILSLIPLLGLIILLIINSRATRILRQYGATVGLLGANPLYFKVASFGDDSGNPPVPRA